jgi:hypothetical protein
LERLAGPSGWSDAAERAWAQTKAASEALMLRLGFSPEEAVAPPQEPPDEATALLVAEVRAWMDTQQPGESADALARRRAWRRLSERGEQQEAERARRQAQQEARQR